MDSCNGGSTVHPVYEGQIPHQAEQGIAIVRGNQQVAMQCLVAVVDQGIKQKEST